MSKDSLKIEEGRDDLPFQIHWELDDAPLTVDAFRVYAHLVRCAGKNGLIFPSYQSIGEKCFRASVGAAANPRSLRNRAMRAVKELIEVGLVVKQVRNKRATSENDSNIYILTPRRQWVEDMKHRRETLEEAIEAAKLARQSEANREGGGILSVPPPGTVDVPPGIPAMPPPGTLAMPRGTLAMPEVTSTEVLQSFEVPSTEETSSSTAAVAKPTPVPDDDGGMADAEKTGDPETPPATEGGDGLLLPGNDETQVEGMRQNPATTTEPVPGAAAPARPALLALTPVPRGELERRPRRDPERMKQLRALLYCSNRDRVADLHVKLSRTTAVARVPRDLFTRLTDAEIQSAVDAARQDMPLDTQKRSFEVLAVLGLERLIGEPLTEEMITGQPPASPATGTPRATPLPDAPAPEVDKIEVGSRWEHKRQEDKVVTVVSFDGPKVELHNGEKLVAFVFTKDYKRVH